MVIIIPTFKNERRRSKFVFYSVQYLCTNAKQYEGRTSEPLMLKEFLVGVAGFEPATPSSRTRCATRLRYTPTSKRDPGKLALGLLTRWVDFGFSETITLQQKQRRAYTIRLAGLQAPAM